MTGDVAKLLRDLAADLDTYVGVQYQRGSHGVHPAMQGRYDRDMEIVHQARRMADIIETAPTVEIEMQVDMTTNARLYLDDGTSYPVDSDFGQAFVSYGDKQKFKLLGPSDTIEGV